MAEEHPLAVQEVPIPSIANLTSTIVKPRISGHFDLKQSSHCSLFLYWGEAKRWLKSELANSISSWNDLACKFLDKFFPSGKITKIRSEIVAFKQREIQSLYAAWERFKGLLRDCPHHNQTNEVLAHTFIEGLHPETKIVVDATAGGQVLEESFDDIYALLNKFSKSNPDWQGKQVASLENQNSKMNVTQNQQQFTLMQHVQPVQQVQVFCEVCGEGPISDACPTNPDSVYFVGNSNRGQANQNQYGNTYNPNWRNHPNFSWGGNQGNQNQFKPQGQYQQFLPPQSDIWGNSPVPRTPDQREHYLPTIEVEAETAKELEKPIEEAMAKQPQPIVAKPPPPFPQRLQKMKDNTAYKKFLDILKQVQINIPLVDILQEVPKYAKYIKEIVANKCKLTEFDIVALTEECSSRIYNKLSPKLKDPGSFIIQISIGKHVVGRALCDLEASINPMPLYVFLQLGSGDPRPTMVVLQLADRSLANPEGIIEDVLVQVGTFIFPANFVILDYEPNQEVLFILGRPFLATSRAIIDVCEGQMTMRVGYKVEVFNV
nr:uncharacterized protein LOC104112008 [Nicotiana tomentosiformis]